MKGLTVTHEEKVIASDVEDALLALSAAQHNKGHLLNSCTLESSCIDIFVCKLEFLLSVNGNITAKISRLKTCKNLLTAKVVMAYSLGNPLPAKYHERYCQGGKHGRCYGAHFHTRCN